MDFKQYIQSGDGKAITISDEGKKIACDFILKNGGIAEVSKNSTINRNALTDIKKRGKTTYKMWEKFWLYKTQVEETIVA